MVTNNVQRRHHRRLVMSVSERSDDTTARRRLLAGTKHLNRSVILGQFVPALQQEIDIDLLEETRRHRHKLGTTISTHRHPKTHTTKRKGRDDRRHRPDSDG